ncbi:MAG: hypothetical protein QNJ55_31210 [Xenococcus sp. MO_188.B8]|nr:hypothetical protein [Xenococcus sp. MO_188.B8]
MQQYPPKQIVDRDHDSFNRLDLVDVILEIQTSNCRTGAHIMSAKGFGKKEGFQKQLKKLKKLEKNLEDVESLRRKGIHFGNVISSTWITQAQEIREKSEQVYGHSLITARLLMITALADLQSFRVCL